MDPPRNPKLDDDLRALLADYRALERMPPADRQQAWRRLEAELHPPAVRLAAPARPRRRHLPAALLLAAAAVLAVWLGADLSRRARDEPAPATMMLQPPSPPPTTATAPHAPPLAPPPEAAPLDVPASSPLPAPAPREPPRARTPPRPPRAAAPPEPAPQVPLDLEQELALLRTARDALARDDASAAAAALAEHTRRFPAGHLLEERRVLQVEALCAAGERDAARRAATSFAQQHPGSPHARKILRVCP